MTNDQEFRLRWNNFQSSVLSSFGNLLEYEELVDVTLACEGQQLKAHKVILCASSTYFRHLFKSNPCQHPIVFLKDVRFEDLKSIMTFVYHGEVNVSQDHLSNLLRTAEALKIKGLAEDQDVRGSTSTHSLSTSNGPQSLGIVKERTLSCVSPPQKRRRRSSSPFSDSSFQPAIASTPAHTESPLKKEPEDAEPKVDCVDVEDDVSGEELLPSEDHASAQILDQDTMDTLLGGVIGQDAMHSGFDNSSSFSGYVSVSSSSLPPTSSSSHTTTSGSGSSSAPAMKMGYECPYCGKQYSYRHTLKVHVLDHHLRAKLGHTCDVCGFVSQTSSGLRAHKYRSHSDDRHRHASPAANTSADSHRSAEQQKSAQKEDSTSN